MSLHRWLAAAALAVATFVLGVAVAPRVTSAAVQDLNGPQPPYAISQASPNTVFIVTGGGDVWIVEPNGATNNTSDFRARRIAEVRR